MPTIELVPVSALHPAPYNPREADTERLELVALSLRKLGFLLPLVATKDGEILSGHQRHRMAAAMGASRVPVLHADIQGAKRRGLNILFNRATNDISVQDTEQDMITALHDADVEALAAELPDIPTDSPDFYPCMTAELREVRTLAQRNVHRFVRHAANVGRMLARLGVHLPIVITPDGDVVNGIGRLEAAARKGRHEIAVVTLDERKAALARTMLNLLSMDFRFTGESADCLRYGAFRRSLLHRTCLGTAFIVPVCRPKRLSDVRLDEAFTAQWKSVCGTCVLDFGSGHGDEARMLRGAGITVTEFEPYPAPNNTVSREQGRASAIEFLAAVRSGISFSTIFVSSVLNSVPFPEDRNHILRIVAALCGPDTLVSAAARGIKSSAWAGIQSEAASYRGSRACYFPMKMEQGTTLGDLAVSPKLQKFFEEDEWKALWERHFGMVQTGLVGGMVTARCRKPLFLHPRDLAESLRFEFNLPYPDGETHGACQTGLGCIFQAPWIVSGGCMIHHSDWTFHGFAKVFDGHVREQLPWYELASAAMGLIARQYIPKGGKVYDLGASTGNVGRVLAPTLEARCARLTALDECPDMVEAYNAPGRALRADITRFDYKPFDVAVAFLALMFLAVPARRKLLTRLRQQLRPGGAIIIFDKLVPPGGYPATVLARLTWASKLDQGAEPGAVVKKELALSGIQRPLYPGELGEDAVEVFRFGDFAGWLIEG